MGVSENRGYLILGALIIRILLFRVLYWGPLFSETPISLRCASLDNVKNAYYVARNLPPFRDFTVQGFAVLLF